MSDAYVRTAINARDDERLLPMRPRLFFLRLGYSYFCFCHFSRLPPSTFVPFCIRQNVSCIRLFDVPSTVLPSRSNQRRAIVDPSMSASDKSMEYDKTFIKRPKQKVNHLANRVSRWAKTWAHPMSP